MDGREVNLNPNNPSSFNNNNNNYPILRDVQAAFKRHRKMPINNMQPRRLVVPRRETVTMVNHETASITPPSILNTPTEDGNVMGVDDQRGEVGLRCDCRSNNMFAQPCLKCRQVVDPLKKVQFALGNDTRSHGSDDHMDTRTTNVLTHMGSLALTEMERDVNNRVDVSAAPSHDANEQNVYNMDIDISSRSNDEISSLLSKGTAGVQKHVSPLRNFLQSDFGHQMTSSSVVGSTCATTTLVNSVNAPMLSSTSHCSKQSQQGSFNAGNSFDMNYHRMTQIDTGNPPKFSNKVLADQNPSAAVDSYPENKHALLRDQQGNEAGSCDMPKDPPPLADNSQPPISNDQISNVKSVTSKSGKSEKPASKKDPSAPRKRSYDPDLFFKVNGKLYQRLGKIGSGGSSEVHKVISQDCTIYALKKIKLKGRDYATAYGFCQEIEYLNKLKGKDHIIQLIDYEVTDKALLKEVLSGSMSIKDGRVKDDGCIFMVLEYGEIDLAHMLSQKWRELDDSRSTIDENWLRFYWQQILLAVKTIHEERVVHSDLKPANFLLVRGSLKLIDFGIAKAILSDTTNIQRDSQVGTLSYMSPEAFMCNETDANGNIIKCGRPSDIWSLGCILYQMVYGRTPFADYTTFWAKFKVITDPNHEIHYEPLSNLWLLDLIKKCLAWDRKERWTIPQLLQHPFLVPPIPPSLSNRNLIELVTDSCSEDPETSLICSRLQQLVSDPIPNIKSVGSGSLTLDQKCTLLDEVSKLCLQLKEQLAYS